MNGTSGARRAAQKSTGCGQSSTSPPFPALTMRSRVMVCVTNLILYDVIGFDIWLVVPEIGKDIHSCKGFLQVIIFQTFKVRNLFLSTFLCGMEIGYRYQLPKLRTGISTTDYFCSINFHCLVIFSLRAVMDLNHRCLCPAAPLRHFRTSRTNPLYEPPC